MIWSKGSDYHIVSDNGMKISRAFINDKWKFTLWKPIAKKEGVTNPYDNKPMKPAGVFGDLGAAKEMAELEREHSNG